MEKESAEISPFSLSLFFRPFRPCPVSYWARLGLLVMLISLWCPPVDKHIHNFPPSFFLEFRPHIGTLRDKDFSIGSVLYLSIPVNPLDVPHYLFFNGSGIIQAGMIEVSREHFLYSAPCAPLSSVSDQ